MSKSNNTSLSSLAFLSFLAGGLLCFGLTLYIFLGYNGSESQKFEYLNIGIPPILLAFFVSWKAEKKLQELRRHF